MLGGLFAVLLRQQLWGHSGNARLLSVTSELLPPPSALPRQRHPCWERGGSELSPITALPRAPGHCIIACARGCSGASLSLGTAPKQH